jgi:DHA1 family tetracycline resistance protein-like MFS transporter
MRLYAGDSGGLAKMLGLVETSNAVLLTSVLPSMTSLSDAIGRRPLLLMTSISALAQQILLSVADPSLLTLTSAELMKVLYLVPTYAVVRAAIGDMHKGDPAAYARAENQLNLIPMVGVVVLPALAGILVKRFDVRMPVRVAVLAGILNVAVISLFFKETLPEEERKPFVWKSSSPLSFLTLFRKTRRLAVLATSETLFHMTNITGRPTMLRQLIGEKESNSQEW